MRTWTSLSHVLRMSCARRLYQTQRTIDAPSWGLPLPDNVLGHVSSMLCEPGSRVYVEEVVAIVDTDKVAIDVKSTRAGVVKELLVRVGDEVKVRQPLYLLEDTDADVEDDSADDDAAARRWAHAYERKVAEEREASARLWREHKRRRPWQQHEGQWSWTHTARPRQTGRSGASAEGHRAEWHHAEGRRAEWRQRRRGATPSARSDRGLSAERVLAMPVDDLVCRVLAHEADPYRCLGLPAGAPRAAVRERYLALAHRLHPDKVSHPKAREAFTVMDTCFRRLQPARQRRGGRW
jgi:pyruvate/2-oxoglutarate dehydrogenase complex dihydrolipoamide acyltransferase (E2) component